MRDNQQERFLIEKNPQRLNAKRIKNSKIQSEHNSDVVRSAEMPGPVLEKEFVTEVSVIPCRLNAGLHEWCNEIATVPN